jgi:hypothetical protein
MFRPIRATQRLVSIFSVTILVPGLILGFFGLRALRQEKVLADQQIRERVNGAAESIGRELEFELRKWQDAADRLAQADLSDRDAWPENLHRAAGEPGAAVVLYRNGHRIESLPPRQLLYDLSEEPVLRNEDPAAPLVAQAESLEFRDKKYAEAMTIYRQLLESGSAARAPVLHGLARNLKKGGQVEEAVQTYRMLEKEPPVLLGSLPSDLMALHEIAELENGSARSHDALRLYEGLVEGRWRLQKDLYVFYSGQAREWIPDLNVARDLIEKEQKKLALTLSAEQFMEMPRSFALEEGASFLAFWHREPFNRDFVRRSVRAFQPYARRERRQLRICASVSGRPACHRLIDDRA